ncbi:MAG: gliding motility protein GldL [Paludibacteraceae bacterium]|nr:gliding motility protein GldL [Paludibacteraceae bacterium]MED9996192.1 gliding motility protein GldL [Paludibacteraceae bacterium]
MAKESFLSSPKGKKLVGYAYGFGAAIVIVGALFKILHLPGASVVLTIGMGTEAILFALSAFEDPHKEYHWDLVFPQLEGGEGGPIMGAAPAAPAAKSGNSIDDIAQAGKLSESDVQKLNDGIRKLSETASQISDVTAAVAASSNYARNMNAASDAIGAFAATQATLKTSSDSLFASYKTVAESMANVASDAKGYMTEMQGITKNLSSINASYEMQVKAISEQAGIVNDVNDNLKKIQTAMDAASAETIAFKDQATKLTQQVSSLNNVYGNMLNAFGARV